MDDHQVICGAAEERFELIERSVNGIWTVGWAREGDERWPCFLEERQAIDWMRDRLSRATIWR